MCEGVAVGGGGIGPEFADAFEGWREAFVVGVAGLGEDAGDPLGVFEGYQEPDWGAIVEDVDCELLEPDDLGEFVDCVGYVDECVGVIFRGWAGGIAETGVVRCDDVEFVGDEGDEVAEGVGA